MLFGFHLTMDILPSREPQAFQLSLKSLGLERQLGDRWGIAASLTNLGNVRFRQGRFDEARELYLEGLEFLLAESASC